MVRLVSRHHEVGQVLSHAIEESTIFTLARLGSPREFLGVRGGAIGNNIRQRTRSTMESTYLWEYVFTTPHNRRRVRRARHRLRLGRMFQQPKQILFEHPCLGVHLLQQGVVSTELTRDGGDRIAEMGERRI